jgi:hypothetical protein
VTGTFLIPLRDAGEECPQQAVQIPASGTGSERAKVASVAQAESPGLQRSVPEEAVHREGRCAASGEAPDRGVPMVVR